MRISKEMLRLKKRIPVIIFIWVIMVTMLMQINTNKLMKSIESAILSSDYYVSEWRYLSNPHLYNTPGVRYVIYSDEQLNDIGCWFNRANISIEQAFENVKIDLSLHRLFTVHNFFDGYIWIRYSVYYTDENENSLGAAVRNPVKLKIHKENGEWKAVRVWVKP